MSVLETEPSLRYRFTPGSEMLAILPVLPFVFLAACGDLDSGSEDPEADLEEWIAEPELRIGMADGPGPLLTRVGAVRIASDGRLVVSQPQDREILVFDPEGEILAAAGGPGEGPGELGSLSSLALDGDSIAVGDSGRRGISYFDMDGTFLSMRGWMLAGDPEMEPGGPMSFPAPPQVFLDDGSALVRPGFGYSFPQDDEGRERYRWPLLRIDAAGQPLDTVGWFELELAWTRMAGLSGPGLLWGPFAGHPLVELAPDGTGAVFVRRDIASDAARGSFTVGRLDPRGDTVAVRSYEYRPVPLPDERIRRYAEEVAGRADGADPPISASDVERALRRGGLVPAFLPPVEQIVPTSDGSIWVKREDVGGDSVAWNVLDADLDRRRRIVLPARFTVHDAVGDVVVGVELDLFDVPGVVTFRLGPVEN
jgi:hypothetical protein